MDYKKIYCDKWRAAYTSNTVVSKDGFTELHWKQIPLGWINGGPGGVIFTKLYRFQGDPELTKIKAFPAADKEFNALLKNVATLESICQMWDTVDTQETEIWLKCHGELYGRILFNNGTVTYEGRASGGWKTSSDPDVMIKFTKYIMGAGRQLELRDDIELISELGSMLKR